MIVATIATVSQVAEGRDPEAYLGLAVIGMFLIPYTTIGALIEDRRPGQVIGRICLTIGALLGTGGLLLVGGVTLEWLPGQPPALAAALTFIGSTILVLVLLLGEPFLVSRFPDGREPGRSGALVDGLLAVAGAVMVPQALLAFGMNIEILGVDADDLATIFGLVIFAAFGLGSFLACVGLVRRYIHGGPIVRAQIRWFAAAIGTSIVFFVLLVLLFVANALFPAIGDQVWTVGSILFLVWILSLLLPPLAIGTAILRHHLYDIDRIVSRSLGYGIVTAALAALFAGAALVIGTVLGSQGDRATYQVAGATLLVVALFGPVRRRAQTIVDRRFDRSHYDASRTIGALTQRLRQDVDLQRLQTDVLGVIDETFQPDRATVWLRSRGPSRTASPVTIPGHRRTTMTRP